MQRANGKRHRPGEPEQQFEIEAVILAGGLSLRMGRDKARLKLGGKTLVSRIRETVRQLGIPLRVIRRDIVPRCGPLGGIYTALATSSASIVLILACDAPFVSASLLDEIIAGLKAKHDGLFTKSADGPGFPMAIRRGALRLVADQIERKELSISKLASRLRAQLLVVKPSRLAELANINTAAELTAARALWRSRGSSMNRVAVTASALETARKQAGR